ncbi:potassium channel family protein [Rhodopila sp.]|jgi:hypothetical protein|uniref:potassium channel family protein n=1 Tax=Rhodopila sp. TaxID=2480087 RepID=UPI002C6647EF|nr:potassium channel family protein [Rhodopila sp.]HVZ06638.1 potassium channel family protein [Rhodopila sp.]
MNAVGHLSFLERLDAFRERACEPALSMLLFVQTVTIFGFVPATAVWPIIPQGIVAILPLTFSSIFIATSRGKWGIGTGAVSLLLSGVVAVLQCWPNSRVAVASEDLAAVVTFSLLSIEVFKAVYGPGRFTGHRVRGAVVLYLNIGLLFTFLYRLIAEFSPSAFAHLPGADHQAALRAALEYFSFSDLTTLGIGDIVPIQPMARALAVLEATMGQLFPATLLAYAVTRAMQGDEK